MQYLAELEATSWAMVLTDMIDGPLGKKVPVNNAAFKEWKKTKTKL